MAESCTPYAVDALGFREVSSHRNLHIFLLGLAAAAADAFGIGSNDVANSFATSVGSGSLSLRAACFIAVFTEFSGAMLLGDHVTKTIKGNIIDLTQFDGQPDTLMLAMLCALCGSALWVNNATRLGLAVSTSHSIVGATIGVGIAFRGTGTVLWGSATTGVGAIVLSWLISPLAAAAFGAALFLITKYVVLKAPDSHARLVTLYPAYVTATFAVVIFFMVLSGAPALKLTKHVNGRQKITNPWAVVGVTLALCAVVYAAAWKGRQTKFFERYIDSIPFASREDGHHTELTQPASKVDKADAAEAGVVVAAAGANGVNGNGKAAKEDDEGERVGLLGDGGKSHEGRDAPASHAPPKDGDVVGGGGGGDEPYAHESTAAAEAAVGAPPPGAPGAVAALRRFAVSGLDQDIVTPQSEAAVAAHAAATRFDPRTERLFSAVQVFTAAFASLAHGSNDVANAVAPLSVISLVWAHGGSVVSASSPTPTWCLAYGGLFIDAGLVLYGYKVMRSLGNNITYHSPSRGFSMELAALTTVLWASSVGAAVSTTHCITGATVGVGLCTGRLDAVNWRMVAWTMMGWVITLPCAGIVAGLLFALIAQSPKTLSSAAAHPGLAFSPPPPMAPSNFTSTSTG